MNAGRTLVETPFGCVAVHWQIQDRWRIDDIDLMATPHTDDQPQSLAIRALQDFTAGRDVAWVLDHLDWDRCTGFQTRAYRALIRLAPWGRTTTYRDLAVAIGQPLAARAIGQAMGANPFPLIIPCHRCLGAGGRLGGFGRGADGCLQMKEHLLAWESRHRG